MPPYAKKSLGQHFLKHDHICDRIAALVQAAADDWLIEIGPGPGALTRAVERLPHARLFLLEKDDRFARERQQEAADNTQAILTDALRFPWARLSPARSWKIIGNLPYNVASPMIWDMAAQCRALRRAAFMVQKEVGQRLAAAPGNGHYGALSVWVQSYWKPRMEFIRSGQRALRRAFRLGAELLEAAHGVRCGARRVFAAAQGGFRRSFLRPLAAGKPAAPSRSTGAAHQTVLSAATQAAGEHRQTRPLARRLGGAGRSGH